MKQADNSLVYMADVSLPVMGVSQHLALGYRTSRDYSIVRLLYNCTRQIGSSIYCCLPSHSLSLRRDPPGPPSQSPHVSHLS